MPSHMNGAPQPSCSSTCALQLAHSRKQSGFSLEAIAEKTKISLRFLRAIEMEEFEKLPGGIYASSYLRQYAATIGYDEGELLAYYARKTNPPVLAESAPPAEKPARSLLDRWLGAPAAPLNVK
jgi:cytoskeletal protein RodZ